MNGPNGDLAGERPSASSLQLYLDGEGPTFLREEVAQWIEHCPETRAEFERLQAISLGIRDLPDLTAPPSLREGIMARIADQTRESAPPIPANAVPMPAPASRWTASLAASFLLVLMVGVWWYLDRLNSGDDQVASLNTANQSTTESETSYSELGDNRDPKPSAKEQPDRPAGNVASPGAYRNSDAVVGQADSPTKSEKDHADALSVQPSVVKVGKPSPLPRDGVRTIVYTVTAAEDDVATQAKVRELLDRVARTAQQKPIPGEATSASPRLADTGGVAVRQYDRERDTPHAFLEMKIEVPAALPTLEALTLLESIALSTPERDGDIATSLSNSATAPDGAAESTTRNGLAKKKSTETVRARSTTATSTGATSTDTQSTKTKDTETKDTEEPKRSSAKPPAVDSVRVVILLVRPTNAPTPPGR